MLTYNRKERRGRLDLRIGSVLNWIQPNSITHVGAHLAEEAWEYSFFDLPVVWVEAIPELVFEIEKLGLPRGQRIVQRLLDETPKQKKVLNLMGENFALSSTLEVRNLEKVYKSIELESSVLDDLTATDLLVLDVQGAELSVLKGGTVFLRECKYIFLEASLSDIYYKKTPTLTDLIAFLDLFDFKLYLRIFHGHNGLEGNCLFVNSSKVPKYELFLLRGYQKYRLILLKYRNFRKQIAYFFKSLKL